MHKSWCFCLLFLFCNISESFAADNGQKVTQDEIELLADQIWAADSARASELEVQYDYQSKSHFDDRTDKAGRKLFVKVDEAVLNRPIYKALINLYPFYNENTGQVDTKSEDELKRWNTAVNTFLDLALKDGPMVKVRHFLRSKGYSQAKTDSAFRSYIYELWFAKYSRAKGILDSSGFEHVFLNEVKNGQAVGLHNWVRMYTLEQMGTFDYAGYTKKQPSVASFVYRNSAQWKSSSLFVRVSPAYEMAIYTMCFTLRLGKNQCTFELPDCSHIRVTTYEIERGTNTHLGTAYPNMVGAPKCTRHHSTDGLAMHAQSSVGLMLIGLLAFAARGL